MGGAGRLSVPPHLSIIFFNLSIYFSCLTLLIYFFLFWAYQIQTSRLLSDLSSFPFDINLFFKLQFYTPKKYLYGTYHSMLFFFLPALIYIMSHLRQHYHKIHVERQLELQHQQRFFNRLFSYLTLDCRIHTALSNKMRSKMIC